ncbi:MAG: hypothetical protein IT382_01240 [Deltaproteobacteria bacterium]|nr:hypothetical protein [Deltaproteobacteria bacterium]
MTVALNTHADIAAALKKLNTTLDQARTLEPQRTADPELATALRTVVKDLSAGEKKRLEALMGGAGGSAQVQTHNPGGASQLAVRLPTVHGGKEPRLDANTPAVAVFLQRYEVDGKASRPLERVLTHAAKLHDVLASEPDPAKLVDKVMNGDLRRHVFLLEGIAKLYGNESKKAGEAHLSAKKLEDTLGALSMHRTNLAYARHVNAPPDVLAFMEKAEQTARGDLEKLLKDEWMPRKKDGQIPALRDLVKGWGDAKWKSYTEDKKYVRGEMVRRLEKIATTPFDMHNLQGGLHELRRNLRWFPIYTESLNGLVQLDPTKNPVKAYEPMLNVTLATSKYVDLPDDSREAGAIRISKSLYVALMQLTLDLGGLKDAGEPVEALAHAFLALKKAKTLPEAEKMAEKLTGPRLMNDVHTNADKVYAEMKKNQLVEKLAESVQRG